LDRNKKKFYFILFSYDVIHNERKIQCLSLIDFRCQIRWQPEILSFNEFTSILNSIPNLEHLTCTLITETNKEKLINSDYVNIEKWKNFCMEFHDLINLDCSITCPLKSSTCSQTDFIRIIANISRSSDRSVNIQLYHNKETNNIDRHDVSKIDPLLIVYCASGFVKLISKAIIIFLLIL